MCCKVVRSFHVGEGNSDFPIFFYLRSQMVNITKELLVWQQMLEQESSCNQVSESGETLDSTDLILLHSILHLGL